MTLGGLALAVGILVDDSTVTIENTHRLLSEEGMPLPQATLHGAAGIAVPTLVSTLAISCVFTSVVFLEGPAKYLFTPARPRSRVRHAGVLRPVEDADADHHRIAAQGREPWPGGRRCERLVCAAFMPALSAASRRCASAMSRLLDRADQASLRHSYRSMLLLLGARGLDISVRRSRLLSRDRRRADPASCPRSCWNADRGDREDLSGGRGQDPRNHSRERPRSDRGQYRIAGAGLQSGVHGRLDHRRQ